MPFLCRQYIHQQQTHEYPTLKHKHEPTVTIIANHRTQLREKKTQELLLENIVFENHYGNRSMDVSMNENTVKTRNETVDYGPLREVVSIVKWFESNIIIIMYIF